MVRFLYWVSFLLGLMFIFGGCAQQVAPSGGEKDKQPPKLVNATPPNKTTNLNAETIELEFHEFIQLGNTRQEVFVSPPLEKNLNIIGRRRTVRIEVPDSLKPNTTYSIYLNNAVKDLTEGNAAEDLKYVFSTGPDLDSLVVKGKVVHGKDLKPVKGVAVGLYKNFSDSAIINERPFYLAETGKEGRYKFENVKEGPYRLFALDDQNRNLKLDPGERLAFLSDTLNVQGDTTEAPRLDLFKQYMEPVKVVNSKLERPGKLMVEFNRKIDTVQFSIPGMRRKKADEYLRIAKNREKALFWFTPVSRDSLDIIARINESQWDTLSFNRSEDFFQNPGDTSFKVEVLRDTFFAKTPFHLKLPDPVTSIGNNCISLHENDSTEKTLEGLELGLANASATRIRLKYPLNADSTYYLRVGEKCFKDMFGRTNDSFKKRLKVKKNSATGLLGMTVKKEDWENQVIVQLIDEDENLRRERIVQEDQKLVFDHLFPGEIRIKAIVDRNGNDRWDGGDWLTKRPPEPVYYFKDPLAIKANWEVREINFQVPSE